MRAITVFRMLGLLASTASVQTRAESTFYLQDGDRVVFYGDSITAQRLYTTSIETYVATRFPQLDVRFFTAGWDGDRVTGGFGGGIDVRLRRDVFAHRPTVMTIMLGMNDASYCTFDSAIFDMYRKGYEHIIDSVKQKVPGIRMTLIEPSPFDDVTRPSDVRHGYNNVLVRYGRAVRKMAKRGRLDVADLNTPVVSALKNATAFNAELSEKIIPDRIHPAAGGQLLMAEALLKSWNAPGTVTAVEIDAANRRVMKAEGTKLMRLKDGNGTWRWTQLDAALPMPVDMNDPVTALAVRSSDFVQALNRQPLKVTGLAAGRYLLTIDLKEVGTFTGEELAEGINLAMLPTPMANQAREVHKRTLQRSDAQFTRWRNVDVALANSKNRKVQKALPDLLARIIHEASGSVTGEGSRATVTDRQGGGVMGAARSAVPQAR